MRSWETTLFILVTKPWLPSEIEAAHHSPSSNYHLLYTLTKLRFVVFQTYPRLNHIVVCCRWRILRFTCTPAGSAICEQGRGVGCSNPPLLFPFYPHIILIEYHTPNYHFFQSQTSGLGRPKIPLEYKLQQNCYCCNSLYFTEIFTSSKMLSAMRNFLLVFNCIVQFSHLFQLLSYSHFRIIQVTGNREIRAKTFSPI